MAKAKGSDLNDKQLLFCKEYLIDLNGTQAAIRAGYSAKTSQQVSSRLLLNVVIQTKIQELKSKRSDRVEVTADMVLAELVKIGFSNIQDYIKQGYTIDDIANIQKDKACAIESVKVKNTYGDYPSQEVSFKLHDKLSALEKISKHIGFFEKDNEQQKDKSTAPIIKVYTSGPPLSNSEDKIS